MKSVEAVVVALNRAVVAVVLAAMLAIVFVNVVGRYGFGSSFAWADEVARHLMILGTFAGVGLALREGRLVSLTFLLDLFPAPLARLVRIAILIVMFAFMGTMFWLGVRFVDFGWNKETMSTGISRGIPYLAVPVGCAIFLLQLAFFARRFVSHSFENEGLVPDREGMS